MVKSEIFVEATTTYHRRSHCHCQVHLTVNSSVSRSPVTLGATFFLLWVGKKASVLRYAMNYDLVVPGWAVLDEKIGSYQA